MVQGFKPEPLHSETRGNVNAWTMITVDVQQRSFNKFLEDFGREDVREVCKQMM